MSVSEKVTTASGVFVILVGLAGGMMWASKTYARVSEIPAIKADAKEQRNSIERLHRNVCRIIGALDLSGDGC